MKAEVRPSLAPIRSRAVVRALSLLLAAGCGSDGANSSGNAGVVVTPPTTQPTIGTPTGPAPSGSAGSSAAIGGSPAIVGASGAMSTGVSGAPGTPAAIGGSPSGPTAGLAGSAAMPGTAGAPALPGAAGSGGNENPADADIETCYELRAHGQPVAGDKTKYAVGPGENYTSFIFKAPWTAPVQGLRFRHLADNAAVLHHWLLYSESAPMADGDVETCSLDGPTGFLCGQAATRSLITGWAPGRGDFRLPQGVGLELPRPGTMLAVEFHYFNSGGAMAQDQSGVEVCTTTKFRPNTASVTWLGTQQINVGGRTMGTASGTCNPLRSGMGASDPIHVLFSWPHMHKLGTHLKSVVTRAAGAQDVMIDSAFDFNSQTLHDTPVMLMPGDAITTTCTFMNTTDNPVGFGQSTTQEMCYNFTYAWPAHALDNPGAELGGAENTCLH